jgi:hypothetical protein
MLQKYSKEPKNKTKCTLQQLLKPNLPMRDENKFDVILTVHRG